MTRLNKSTCASCPDNRFITFFTCIADPKTGEVVYTNAGHNPPLVVRAKGGFETLEGGGGMILGILPMAQYEEAHVTLDPGDILVLFSDGVTEAVDPEDQRFRRGAPGEPGGRAARSPGRRDRPGSPSRGARLHARRSGRR